MASVGWKTSLGSAILMSSYQATTNQESTYRGTTYYKRSVTVSTKTEEYRGLTSGTADSEASGMNSESGTWGDIGVGGFTKVEANVRRSNEGGGYTIVKVTIKTTWTSWQSFTPGA